MIRAVLDPNVLISALISPEGVPAHILSATEEGRFGLVVSERLVAELEDVLMREKFRRYASVDEADAHVRRVREVGIFAEEAQSAEDADTPEIAAAGPTGREGEALSEANAKRHRWIARAGRQHREVVRWGYKRMADLRASATDPDASPMQRRTKAQAGWDIRRTT